MEKEQLKNLIDEAVGRSDVLGRPSKRMSDRLIEAARDYLWTMEGVKVEYQKHEFCKAEDCPVVRYENKCNVLPVLCIRTAKEFHKWLSKNGFEIVKVEK